MWEDGGSSTAFANYLLPWDNLVPGGRAKVNDGSFSMVFRVLQAVYCIRQFGNHLVCPCPWSVEFLTFAPWYIQLNCVATLGHRLQKGVHSLVCHTTPFAFPAGAPYNFAHMNTHSQD